MLSPDNNLGKIKDWILRPLIILVIGILLILGASSVQAKYTYRKPYFPKIHIVRRIPTPTPTATATPTPLSPRNPGEVGKPKPTNTPTPTPSSVQEPIVKTPVQESPTIPTYLLAEVNKYRSSQGKSASEMDYNTCDFAKKRAQEISVNFNHDGFNNLPYSGYSKITENIAMTSDFKDVIPMWINSSGHAENMRADTPFICVENFGNYYVLEGWNP